MIKQQRIDWIDICKGIGIILVLIGHGPIPTDLKIFIYSFHMPLFFFLSGFVFSTNKFNNFFEFFKNRFTRLIIPYLSLSFLLVLIYVSYEKTINMYSFSTKEVVLGFIYSKYEFIKIGIPLWFLTCIFIVSIFFYFISKFNKDFYIILTLAVLSILGFISSRFVDIRLPWSIDTALTATVFFGAGYLIKKNAHIFLRINMPLKDMAIIAFLCTFIFSYLNSRAGRTDMFANIYNNPTFYYIAAFSGIGTCILISMIIRKSNILSFFGRNTITLLAFHINVYIFINFVILKIRNSFGLDIQVYDSFWWSVTYTTITLISLFPIILFLNKFMPIVVGLPASSIKDKK